MREKRRSALACAALVFFALALLVSSSYAHNGASHQVSDNSSAITAALHWLESAQSSDGRIVTEFDVASDIQATSESVAAVKLSNGASVDDAAALAVLSNDPELLSSEYLAHLISLRFDLGLGVTSEVTELISRQGADGGFGDFSGYGSTPLDTAYALMALQHVGKDAAVAGLAVSYLSSIQLASGGFGYYGEQSSVMVTGLVVKALKPYLYTFNISSLLSSAVNFLYSLQGADGLWGSDWETALVLQSLIPITSDVTRYETAINTLVANQTAEGSWAGQAYATALAISTLVSVENIEIPADPEKALIRGRVVSGINGNGIANTIIDVRDLDSESVIIERSGQFAISNLDGGSYIVTYSAPGYLPVSQSVSLQKGQFADIGTVVLQVAPSASLISGVLTDSSTGAAIAGASIIVTVNGISQSAVSDESGAYQLLSELGEASFKVISDSYHEVNANAELAAGTAVNFSPALLASSEARPNSSNIAGLVIDESDQAIADAALTLLGTDQSASTNTEGVFNITGLAPVPVELEISKPGYAAQVVSFIIPENSHVNAGAIRLREQPLLATSSLTGQVLDLSTGAPVAGATVQTDYSSVTTGNNGFYRITNIPVLEFTASVNAPGYLITNKDISLTHHADLPLNFNIRQADLGGVEIAALATQASAYSAYQGVVISTTLRNDTALTQGARLYVRVKDRAGREVDAFSGRYLPPLDSALDEEELAHYQQHLAGAIEELAPGEQRLVELEQWWNTKNNPPGDYVITVQAVDGATSNLVSEKSVVVTVEETRRLASLKVSATPAYVLLNGQADVALSANLLNRSNVATVATFNYRLKSPSGQVLFEGQKAIELAPEQDNVSTELAVFPYQFSLSGDYIVELSDVGETRVDELVGGNLFVPPSIRLEINQFLTPNEVVPLEGVSVQSNIQVKGVDGE